MGAGDRTERARLARAEDRLRVLAESMHAFAETTSDEARLFAVIAQRVAEVVGDQCILFVLSDDGQALLPIAMHASEPGALARMRALVVGRLELSQHVAAAGVVRTGRTHFVPRLVVDELRSPDAFRASAAGEGLHSLLVVALRARGRTLGVLTITRVGETPEPLDEGDREMAEHLADQAALAMDNARAYSREAAARTAAEEAVAGMRASQARFARLAESGTLGILVTRGLREGPRVIEVNDALSRMVGYSRAELLAGTPPWPSLTSSRWLEFDERASAELERTGVASLREKEYTRKDGTTVPVLVGSAFIDGGPEAISFVVDLSERARARAEISRLERERSTNALFRSVMEAAPDAMLILDAERRISLTNAQADRTFGYARGELVGQPVNVLAPERVRTPHAEGEVCLGDVDAGVLLRAFVARRKDGTEFPAELTASSVVFDDTRLLTLAVRDVTDRMRHAELQTRLAAIVASSEDAIIGHTLDGAIVSWNASAQRLYGYTAEEAIGRDIRILYPQGHEAEREHELAKLGRGETIGNFETKRKAKDGHVVHVSVTSSLVRDAAGAVIGASKVVRDVTERKNAQDALLQAKVAADDANRELATFSYSVAHDLRAPLRAIRGFAEILGESSEGKLDADGADALQEIRRASQGMSEMLDSLLELSRLSRVALRRVPVDLSAVAAEITRRLSAESRRDVEVVIEGGLTAEIDLGLGRAVLENLLGNAWKFSAKTPSPRVELGRTGEDSAVFFVKDNGAGFDMEYATKLFAPFQRLHRATEFAGTGIGLATVQRIVHRHGGRIWAEAKPGAGATFFFTLPPSRNAAEAGE